MPLDEKGGDDGGDEEEPDAEELDLCGKVVGGRGEMRRREGNAARWKKTRERERCVSLSRWRVFAWFVLV